MKMGGDTLEVFQGGSRHLVPTTSWQGRGLRNYFLMVVVRSSKGFMTVPFQSHWLENIAAGKTCADIKMWKYAELETAGLRVK